MIYNIILLVPIWGCEHNLFLINQEISRLEETDYRLGDAAKRLGMIEDRDHYQPLSSTLYKKPNGTL